MRHLTFLTTMLAATAEGPIHVGPSAPPPPPEPDPLPDLATLPKPARIDCPKCGAPAGCYCMDGRHLKHPPHPFHMARVRAAQGEI